MRSLRVRKTRSRERDGGIVEPVRGARMENGGGGREKEWRHVHRDIFRAATTEP